MYNSQILSDRIKQQAKSNGIKLKDMLIQLDLNINTISQISDKKGLSCFPLARIADYLNCSVDYLLGRTEQPELQAYADFLTENEHEFLQQFRLLPDKDKQEIKRIIEIKLEDTPPKSSISTRGKKCSRANHETA